MLFWLLIAWLYLIFILSLFFFLWFVFIHIPSVFANRIFIQITKNAKSEVVRLVHFFACMMITVLSSMDLQSLISRWICKAWSVDYIFQRSSISGSSATHSPQCVWIRLCWCHQSLCSCADVMGRRVVVLISGSYLSSSICTLHVEVVQHMLFKAWKAWIRWHD